MTERRLRVGVIGAGGIARAAHLPNLKRNPRVEVVAVADMVSATAKQAAADFDVPRWYDSLEELVNDPAVEAVTVCTWPGAHASAVVAAAAAGKHVLCEKPIAASLADADRMVEAADAAGVTFAMGYQHRFGVELPLLRRLLDAGVVGRPMGMTQVGVSPSSHHVPWFLQKEISGGGVLIDWGIYTAHTILWLMGPVASVYGVSETFRPNVQVGEQLLTDVDVEDTVMATLRFESGALGSWYAAWAVAASHHTMTIDGSAGSIRTHREAPGVEVYSTVFSDPEDLRGWRHVPTKEPPLAEIHYRKLADFVDAVLDDRPVRVTGAEGRAALELVEAVYRSAGQGQPVRLPLERVDVSLGSN